MSYGNMQSTPSKLPEVLNESLLPRMKGKQMNSLHKAHVVIAYMQCLDRTRASEGGGIVEIRIRIVF